MIYLDTGCLVKLYYPEPESSKVIALVQNNPICYTPLHELEFVNALYLKIFHKGAAPAQAIAARAMVAEDLKAGVLIAVDTIWKEVFAEAAKLAVAHTPTVGCRSLDILHCAAALVIAADQFISTDERQKRLAQAMGLKVTAV